MADVTLNNCIVVIIDNERRKVFEMPGTLDHCDLVNSQCALMNTAIQAAIKQAKFCTPILAEWELILDLTPQKNAIGDYVISRVRPSSVVIMLTVPPPSHSPLASLLLSSRADNISPTDSRTHYRETEDGNILSTKILDVDASFERAIRACCAKEGKPKPTQFPTQYGEWKWNANPDSLLNRARQLIQHLRP